MQRTIFAVEKFVATLLCPIENGLLNTKQYLKVKLLMRTTVKASGLVISALLLMYTTAFTQQVQVPKTISNSSSPDGLIGFLEFRPSDYGSQKHPLIIFLHGAAEGGNGTSDIGKVAWNSLPNLLSTGKASMRFTYNGQTSSFVVISPQLSKAYFYWPSFYVRDIINYAKANLQIDPNRIYVTGLSLGGGGVWRLISDAQTLDPSFDAGLAAVAPVCATGEQSDADYCRTVGANNLPVWAFHSADDVNVPASVTQHVEAVSLACGVVPAGKFTYYQAGGHGGAWTNAYDTGHITRTLSNGSSFTANPNLFEWFLSNTRSGAGTNTPPSIAVSGPRTIVLPTSSVTISGTGTGTNGATISSYSWRQTSGPSTSTIVSAASSSTNITGLQQGVYVFTLTVTDNHGLTSSAGVTVTVNPAAGTNQSPVANAGSAETITGNAVTLNGSASVDPDGSIVEYYWVQTSGPSSSVIANNFAVTTTASNLLPGQYAFLLQVKDNAGALSYAEKRVTINAVVVNQAPVPNAGIAQTITLPVNSITLDGTASSDPDGSIVEHYWVQTNGPAAAVIANNFSAATTAGSLVQGAYTFLLQVKDNSGALSYAEKKVTVNAATGVNQPPVSNAGSAVTIVLPANTAVLNGSASSDPDGNIVEYYWMQTSGPSAVAIPNNFSVSNTVTNLVKGVYTFLLQVKDNAGALAYSVKTVTVSSSLVNQPPVSNAGTAQSIVLPANTGTLDGSASNDPDGSIVQYYWSQVSGPTAAVIGDNFAVTTTAAPLVNGVYLFQLQVKDNSGALTYSTKSITVSASGARVAFSGNSDSSVQNGRQAMVPVTAAARWLSIYPNPVQSSASIALYSEDAGIKLIHIYTGSGILAASYRWQTVMGKNTFQLRNVSGLPAGQYTLMVTSNTGKQLGAAKFIKVQ